MSGLLSLLYSTPQKTLGRSPEYVGKYLGLQSTNQILIYIIYCYIYTMFVLQSVLGWGHSNSTDLYGCCYLHYFVGVKSKQHEQTRTKTVRAVKRNRRRPSAHYLTWFDEFANTYYLHTCHFCTLKPYNSLSLSPSDKGVLKKLKRWHVLCFSSPCELARIGCAKHSVVITRKMVLQRPTESQTGNHRVSTRRHAQGHLGTGTHSTKWEGSERG